MNDPAYSAPAVPPAWTPPPATWPAAGPGWDPPPGAGWPSPPQAPPHTGRSSKLPYLIGAALIVLGLAGAAMSVVGMVGVADSPTSDHQFDAGTLTTVSLDAGQSKTIYVADTTGRASGMCAVKKPGHLTTYNRALTINQWRAVYTLTGDRAGDYSVLCTGTAARFSVGSDGSGSFVAIFVGMFGGGAMGLIGLVVVVVATIRRRKPIAQTHPY